MRVLIDGQTLGTPEIERGIGKVFRMILYHLINGDVAHDWFLAVRDPRHLEVLEKRLYHWIKPKVLPPLHASGEQIYWCRAYGEQLNSVAAALGADIYWNPNPLMPNVLYPIGFSEAPIAVTLYDLIPRKMSERFQKLWPKSLWEDYLDRIEEIASRASSILAISKESGKDFLNLYPETAHKIQAIPLASDYSLFWPYVQGDRLSQPPYVLYVGGFDPRKNMDNALQAFARFLPRIDDSEKVRFKVVCAYGEAEQKSYMDLARKLGVEERLDLPGYVEDDELGRLFRSAGIFFFPSFYEGFGLPVLDALACGLPVVASHTSSIPEVAGEHAIYCNPQDVEDMAEKLALAWMRRDPYDPERLKTVEYARTFRWPNAAAAYLRTFKEVTNRRSTFQKSKRPRVAYLSPWPPQKTGVADYSYRLMPELTKRMDVTLFVEDPNTAVCLPDVPVRNIEEYPAAVGDFDTAIYHLGNGLTHLRIYEMAWHYPGIIILHDFNIHPFFRHGFLGTEREILYELALKEYGAEGEAAWAHYRKTKQFPDVWKFPMTHAIARRSRATVVHSRWVAEQLGESKRIYCVHLGGEPQEWIDPETVHTLKRKLCLDTTCFWIGIFGFVNSHKRVDKVIEAIADLERRGYPVRLLIVGEINDARVNLSELLDKHDVHSIVHHQGYIPEAAFLEAMKAMDLIVSLRYPTMGESSASLFDALSLGKPVITSDYGAFSDIPDCVTWKIAVDDNEVVELISYLEVLMKDPEINKQISRNALNFVKAKATFSEVADTYLQAIGQSNK